jgi:FdhE protein
MSSPASLNPPQFPPVHIGDEAKPPVAVLPNPETLFAERARRFLRLASDHQLRGYLEFLASVSASQATILSRLPAVKLPDADELERAFQFGMAPIARQSVAIDATVLATLEALLRELDSVTVPERGRAALAAVKAADPSRRITMIAAVLEDALPVEELAEHILVAAAMQVHFSRLAAALPSERITSVADGACPACGGPPVSSSVVGWLNAQSARFVACACCATQWHVVRVKCVACSSTKGISYSHVEGTAETLKAECCDTCRSYLKIFYLTADPALDPVADDVASAGLDLLVREKGFRRAGFNVFLAGF